MNEPPPAPAAGMNVTAARASTRSRTARNLTTASAVIRRRNAYPARMHKRAVALLAMGVALAGCGGGKHVGSSAGAKVFASAGCGGGPTLLAGERQSQNRPQP